MSLKTVSQIKWEGMSPEEQEVEESKCVDSAAYFYNNYMRPEGGRMFSDEEIELARKKSESVIIRGRGGRSLFMHPKTMDEAFEKIKGKD